MEPTKNLCAQVPASLHAKVRQEQETSGKTLSQYITDVLTDYYEKGAITMNNRTMAFQIPEEMFQRLKKYLKDNNLKQKEFVLGLIERALNDAEQADAPTAVPSTEFMPMAEQS